MNQIAPYTRDISKRCRNSSIQRKHLRDFEMDHEVATEKIEIISQATLPATQRKELARGAERAIQSMEEIAHMDGLELAPDQLLAPRVRAVKARLNEAVGTATERLLRLSLAGTQLDESPIEVPDVTDVRRGEMQAIVISPGSSSGRIAIFWCEYDGVMNCRILDVSATAIVWGPITKLEVPAGTSPLACVHLGGARMAVFRCSRNPHYPLRGTIEASIYDAPE